MEGLGGVALCRGEGIAGGEDLLRMLTIGEGTGLVAQWSHLILQLTKLFSWKTAVFISEHQLAAVTNLNLVI